MIIFDLRSTKILVIFDLISVFQIKNGFFCELFSKLDQIWKAQN